MYQHSSPIFLLMFVGAPWVFPILALCRLTSLHMSRSCPDSIPSRDVSRSIVISCSHQQFHMPVQNSRVQIPYWVHAFLTLPLLNGLPTVHVRQIFLAGYCPLHVVGDMLIITSTFNKLLPPTCRAILSLSESFMFVYIFPDTVH